MRLLAALLCLQSVDLVKEVDPKALTAHVSFLASDLLEGRDTPSKGLDIAAEYIASEFRRAGLQPLPDGTYFQTVKMNVRRLVREGFDVKLTSGDKVVTIPAPTAFWTPRGELDLSAAAVRKISAEDLDKLTEKITEPVVVLTAGTPGPAIQRGLTHLVRDGVKLVILLGIPAPMPAQAIEFADEPPSSTVYLRSTDRDVEAILKEFPEGLKVSAHIPAATTESAEVRNVIGILPGTIKDEYVLLSAHYDHIGVNPRDPSDKINNGANDNASGTSSLIESAVVLSQMPTPKRSIIFMAFFGEEKGMLGSRYFTRHPVFPLKSITANLNLEQTGRTDSSEGTNANMVNLTGYHFSTIHKFVEEAGKSTGINAVKHERFGDQFYTASDNIAFAFVGIPATTLSVTYQFPDYHAKGDEWPKLDFSNQAKVTRTIAQATYLMATSEEKVVWNETEPKTEAFRKAAVHTPAK